MQLHFRPAKYRSRPPLQTRILGEVRDPVWLAKAYRGNYLIDLITGVSNAAITVDDTWIEHSLPATVLGLSG
jgi:hypothetical protein